VALYVIFFFLSNFLQAPSPGDPNVYLGKSGFVQFISYAALERIEAHSNKLSGALHIQDRTFYFSIPINSFFGFNGALQREHFNEDYLESEFFSDAVFKGRIIEEIDFSVNGTYPVRVKGMLTIHGITVERIISGKLIISPDRITITSVFVIPLADHNIIIPRIVEMKIAKEVEVTVNIELFRS
jgi:YceI-like domain